VTERSLTTGNEIEPLVGGDEAFPVMLQAIDEAQHSIGLSSYIFDRDSAGLEFVAALQRAVERGVEVRVLIDSVGSRYSFPSIFRELRQAKIPAAAFLPALSPSMIRFFNLRNHRKIMVVDGHIGFTGGMNIRAGNMLSRPAKHHVQDVHFRLDGPVVSQLQEVFAVDWHFTTRELLDGPAWFPDPIDAGRMLARGVTDGPDDDIDRIQLAFMGALSCARRRVVIMTPYFLPETPLIDALNVCSMRGVDVDVILPSANNLPYMTWAMMATVPPLLERNVRIWLTPPPFDHTKVMVVDDVWSSFGSSNWDPRSLRLNFEFNVECYSPQLAAKLVQLATKKLEVSKPLTQHDLDQRSLPVRLRDGIVRLGLPYL
jgi:cardiolipin synthase